MSDLDRARQEYYRVRVENLRHQVPMVRVLEHLGIRVHVNENVEIQYPCPLHGDGQDQGFSARVYPGDNDDPGGHTFCWGCQQARDQIQWIRDYQGMSFMGAVKFLEDTFDVKGVPSIYDYFDPSQIEKGADGILKTKLEREIDAILNPEDTEEFSISYLERKIDRLVADKGNQLTRLSITRLYFLFDMLSYDLKEGTITEEEARNLASKIEAKIETLHQKE